MKLIYFLHLLSAGLTNDLKGVSLRPHICQISAALLVHNMEYIAIILVERGKNFIDETFQFLVVFTRSQLGTHERNYIAHVILTFIQIYQHGHFKIITASNAIVPTEEQELIALDVLGTDFPRALAELGCPVVELCFPSGEGSAFYVIKSTSGHIIPSYPRGAAGGLPASSL